jgi:hypothetical protein
LTPGIDCDFTLAHPAVNGGTAVGFFLALERGRKAFATRRARAGKPVALATGGTAYADFGGGAREWRLTARFEPDGVSARQAAASGGTFAQLRSFYALDGALLTLVTPAGESYQVRFLSLEERTSPPEPFVTAELALAEAQ